MADHRLTKIIFFFAVISLTAAAYYTHVNNRIEEVVYLYPNKIRDDSQLEPCKEYQACGSVHSRFWLPPLIYRECRCPNKKRCSNSVTYTDNHSIRLNNRASLKICEPVSDMELCGENELGVTIHELRFDNDEFKRTIQVHCRCEWPAYWQRGLHTHNATHTQSSYHCTTLVKCQVGEFCGHIRSDISSAYYKCYCPRGSLCISQDTAKSYNASEILYEGQMYRGYCYEHERTIE